MRFVNIGRLDVYVCGFLYLYLFFLVLYVSMICSWAVLSLPRTHFLGMDDKKAIPAQVIKFVLKTSYYFIVGLYTTYTRFLEQLSTEKPNACETPIHPVGCHIFMNENDKTVQYYAMKYDKRVSKTITTKLK